MFKRELKLKERIVSEFHKSTLPGVCNYYKKINEVKDKIDLTLAETSMLSDEVAYDYLEDNDLIGSRENPDYDISKIEPGVMLKIKLAPVMHNITDDTPKFPKDKLPENEVKMWGEAFKKLDSTGCVGIGLGVGDRTITVELHDYSDFVIVIAEGRFLAFKRMDNGYVTDDNIISIVGCLGKCVEKGCYLANAPVEYLDLLTKKED